MHFMQRITQYNLLNILAFRSLLNIKMPNYKSEHPLVII